MGVPRTVSGARPPSARSVKGLLIGATLFGLLIGFIPYGPTATLPIRYFVTYLHEISHALAGLATGGTAENMHIYPSGSGDVQILSRYVFITSSAGYVGSTVFGAVLLILGKRPAWSRVVFYGLSALITFAAIYWVRPLFVGFGFWIGLAVAFLLFSAGRWLGDRARTFVLQFLAVQCCLSSAQDIAVLLRLNAAGYTHNDAGLLAQQTGLPPMFWAVCWTLVSATILLITTRALIWPRVPRTGSRPFTIP